jgi:hypothetical protein
MENALIFVVLIIVVLFAIRAFMSDAPVKKFGTGGVEFGDPPKPPEKLEPLSAV